MVDARLPIVDFSQLILASLEVRLKGEDNSEVILWDSLLLEPEKQAAQCLVRGHNVRGRFQQGTLVLVIALPGLGLACLHNRVQLVSYLDLNASNKEERNVVPTLEQYLATLQRLHGAISGLLSSLV